MTDSLKIKLITFGLFLNVFIKGQQTAIYNDVDAQFKLGLELFDKKQFVNAQKNFTDYYSKNKISLLKSDALYYAAACGIELFNKDSEWMMKHFIEKYPESLKLNSAYFYLGKSNYRKKKYKETIEFFDKVDIYNLDQDQLSEYYFKRGYSYLQTDNEMKAKPDFTEIKDTDNKYKFPALYYFSHISYKEKNYEVALQGFNKLLGNETFGSTSPYYITQIYFIQGNYESVVKEAPKLLNDTANIQKEGEINRMIGESYFNLKDYKNA